MEIKQQRLLSIDAYRGFTMLLMVAANLSGRFFAPVFAHALMIPGYNPVDLIEPMFYFAISLTYIMSFESKCSKSGTKDAVYSFIHRYLALIGIGFLISTLTPEGYPFGDFLAWGTLQSIGLAGLISLPFIKANRYIKIASGLAMIAVFQALLSAGGKTSLHAADGDNMIYLGEFTRFAGTLYHSVNDNLIGTLPKAGMLLTGIGIVEIYRKHGKKEFWIVLGALAAVSAASLFVFPISQRILTASYALCSLTLSILVYLLFEYVFDSKGMRFPLFVWWGRNSILIYILNQTLGYAVTWGNTPLLRLLSILIWSAVLSVLAYFLNRKKWYIRL